MEKVNWEQLNESTFPELMTQKITNICLSTKILFTVNRNIKSVRYA